jgi:hypothetical protein
MAGTYCGFKFLTVKAQTIWKQNALKPLLWASGSSSQRRDALAQRPSAPEDDRSEGPISMCRMRKLDIASSQNWRT